MSLSRVSAVLCDSQDIRPSQGSVGSIGNEAMTGLRSTLLGHEVAMELQPKTARGDVASELAAIFGRVRRVDLNYQHYWPLSLLVIKEILDVEI